MTASESVRRSIPSGAQVHSWTAADGWELRSFAWPAEGTPRGSILFQGGRGDIFEKYLESFDHWHAQGWTITSFDWRGQGGSGRLTERRNCGHIESFDEYIADFRAFYAQWEAATPGPHVVIAHSMGGHNVLRALVAGDAKPDAVVLVAPMLGVHAIGGAWIGERLAKLMGGVGDMSRPAWKTNEKPYTTESRKNLLTKDSDRYADEIFWHETRPDLVTGSPSWKWVVEAFKSMRELRSNPRLKTMKVPVLMLIADADGLVDPKAVSFVASKLPDARVVRFGKESAHEILRETDKVLNRAIGEIDLFLAARAQKG